MQNETRNEIHFMKTRCLIENKARPHPGPLPQGEGVIDAARAQTRRVGNYRWSQMVHPLLGERAGVREDGTPAINNHSLFQHGLILAMVICILALATAPAAEPAESGLLQKGLYEEEANHDLKAAIEAYQALVTQFDAQRAATATAIFRLGECYRKQGKTNEATAFYQRILRDFADQTELARLSKTFAPAQIVAKGTGGESEADKQKRSEIQTRINNLQEGLNSIDSRIEQANAQFSTATKEYADARKLLDEAHAYPSYALPIQTDDPQFLGWKQAYAREAPPLASGESLAGRRK